MKQIVLNDLHVTLFHISFSFYRYIENHQRRKESRVSSPTGTRRHSFHFHLNYLAGLYPILEIGLVSRCYT